MARGWESKAIEAQQSAAADDQLSEGQRHREPLSPEEARQQRERATLMLARTRALSDLQQACAPAHRAMLERAVADLDIRLKALAS